MCFYCIEYICFAILSYLEFLYFCVVKLLYDSKRRSEENMIFMKILKKDVKIYKYSIFGSRKKSYF